ncbi:AAA family ATPase [Polaromonas sp.]|uniref:AAA family ATPase n=1 Tax=Polaromonas sp. TaxID=1869339 RepID=UPI003BACB848
MTLFEPTLQLVWLKILRNKGVAYLGSFHEGVNIISGQNASGKSTVMDFIFYVLGGENVPWKNEALLCDEVFAEVQLNGVPITLRRQVNEAGKNSIAIYWGNLESAEAAPFASWETYPYQRSGAKESFSQVLFRLMGLPELRGEGAANITMHQLLRLLYVDQRTPHDQIFRSESFDTILTRETVGNYLCGVYSSDLYDAQLSLKTIESQLGKSVSDLKNLFSILGKSGQTGNTSDFLRAESAAIQDELATAEVQLIDLRQARSLVTDSDSAKSIGASRAKLSKAQKELVKSEESLAELQLEIEDSKLFISEVDRRIDALNDSEIARSYLGSIRFQFCPCCLSPTHEEPANKQSCALCKEPVDTTVADSQLLRMKNELALQKRESSGLLESRIEKLAEHSRKLPALKNDLRQLEQEYSQLTSVWSSPVELQIEALSRRVGELNQKLEQIAQYYQLASVIEDLQNKRSELENQKSRLQDAIFNAESRDEKLKEKARLAIAENLVTLLKSDLPRQDEFISAAAVDWSFAHDRISVNGHTQFSESSMVILKQSFHMALLVASAQNGFFRIPRFILLDGIEDGGQETLRSHQLQKNIVQMSSKLEISHQIIFATSQIAPALAGSELVVGEMSTVDKKTLSIH